MIVISYLQACNVTDHVTSTQKTPEISKENTSTNTQPENISVTLKDYSGLWYSQDSRNVKDKYGDIYTSGSQIILNIPNNGKDGTIKITSASLPPASRIASFETKLHLENNYTGTFSFDNDGWGHKGEGTVSFNQNNNQIDVDIEFINSIDSNWGVFIGKRSFIRNIPEPDHSNNENSTKKDQNDTSQAKGTIESSNIVNFTIGQYKASLEVPAKWKDKYHFQDNGETCYFYYKSKLTDNFLLFELIPMPNYKWDDLNHNGQGDSGNYYTLLTKQGNIDFVYRTHVIEDWPVEDEYNTILADFKKSLAKTFKIN